MKPVSLVKNMVTNRKTKKCPTCLYNALTKSNRDGSSGNSLKETQQTTDTIAVSKATNELLGSPLCATSPLDKEMATYITNAYGNTTMGLTLCFAER